MSEVQRHMADVNERYQLVGDKLTERKFDLEGALEKAQTYRDEVRDFLAWMEKAETQLKEEVSPGATAQEANKKLQDHLVHLFFKIIIIVIQIRKFFLLPNFNFTEYCVLFESQ